jgi:hypothetical protein
MVAVSIFYYLVVRPIIRDRQIERCINATLQQVKGATLSASDVKNASDICSVVGYQY